MKNSILRKAFQNPDNIFCLTEGCINYFLVKPNTSQWVSCTICNRESYLKGRNVEDKFGADDMANKEYLEQELGAKKCPSCNFYIIKNGGCPHMTCSRCKHEFDWYSLYSWKVNCPNCSLTHYYSEEANNLFDAGNPKKSVICQNKNCQNIFDWF